MNPAVLAEQMREWAKELEAGSVPVRSVVAGLRQVACDIEPSDTNLAFDRLRRWRADEARAKEVPPYVILTDAVARRIASAMPKDMAELAAVPGFGAAKVYAYGDAILAVLREAKP